MKTLAMNKFTKLMEQLSTGATTNINKADKTAPTGFKHTKHNNCSWVCQSIFRHDYPIAVEPASTPRPLVQKKNFESFSNY
jgi:hypothetical protein